MSDLRGLLCAGVNREGDDRGEAEVEGGEAYEDGEEGNWWSDQVSVNCRVNGVGRESVGRESCGSCLFDRLLALRAVSFTRVVRFITSPWIDSFEGSWK